MSLRDDFGSGAGRPGGYGGGAGGLGNGGIGGGMGGGGMGGGAGRNGGIGSRTGMTTGNRMYGGMAFGRPGGAAMNPGAWGVHPQAPVQSAPLNRPTMPLAKAIPASIPGVNPVPENVPQMPNTFYSSWKNQQAILQDLVNRRYGTPSGTPAPNAPASPDGSTVFGPRVNYWGGWPSMMQNENVYNDPRFGMPSGILGNGLAQAGTGQTYGYDGGNGGRR